MDSHSSPRDFDDAVLLNRIAAMVASGDSLDTIAAALDVSRSVVGKISRQPCFAPRVATYRRQTLERLLGRVTYIADTAADVLTELLGDDCSDGTRLAAAQTVLGLVKPLNELSEFRKLVDGRESDAATRLKSRVRP
tara:strand:- start:152642 stop:153052 length:411 start_codon:yes stop_codon:yes gene_type:complete